ncbi:hypothetical protein CPB83DRAFT_840741 [Crepidotus variabilis]|uniref:Uncharacterized protein n=1 Tax=Crepidotus variabilis TaxID=179855 RepID=A0A9P6JIK8_9AGAR|nr:hypothetical protein CPB83DRAFT_840741 [Crepidotus variabilis]
MRSEMDVDKSISIKDEFNDLAVVQFQLQSSTQIRIQPKSKSVGALVQQSKKMCGESKAPIEGAYPQPRRNAIVEGTFAVVGLRVLEYADVLLKAENAGAADGDSRATKDGGQNKSGIRRVGWMSPWEVEVESGFENLASTEPKPKAMRWLLAALLVPMLTSILECGNTLVFEPDTPKYIGLWKSTRIEEVYADVVMSNGMAGVVHLDGKSEKTDRLIKTFQRVLPLVAKAMIMCDWIRAVSLLRIEEVVKWDRTWRVSQIWVVELTEPTESLDVVQKESALFDAEYEKEVALVLSPRRTPFMGQNADKRNVKLKAPDYYLDHFDQRNHSSEALMNSICQLIHRALSKHKPDLPSFPPFLVAEVIHCHFVRDGYDYTRIEAKENGWRPDCCIN